MDKRLRSLQKKLERMELEHLRQHALELHERLERAEADLEQANENASFWQRDAHELQLALLDEGHATHRCVGINKAGELMVVQMFEPSNTEFRREYICPKCGIRQLLGIDSDHAF